MKYLFITGTVLLALSVFAVTGGYIWYQQQLAAPPDGSDETVNVEISPGMSSQMIAEDLKEKGLIRDAFAFRLLARLNSASDGIQAGFYQIPANLPAREVLAQITEGKVAQKILLIPGGVTLLDITEIMEENGFATAEIQRALGGQYEFSVLADRPARSDLEGYLYPDTYHIGADASAEEFISIVLSNTELKIDDDIRKQWRSQGFDVHEGLTLASIVQKEASERDDQRRIAQVFMSRLKQDRKLEADPTYLYGARISGRQGSPRLDSPYNTYKHKGLPPGPIANVEEGALSAVAEPADTDFLFFVTGEDGVTRFSKNRDQHEEYIERFGISQ